MAHPLIRARAASPPLRCATCHGDLFDDDTRWSCPGCATVLHEDCVRGLGRCATAGCDEGRGVVRVVQGARARPARRAGDDLVSAAVYAVPAAAALLWPLTLVGLYHLLEATICPVRTGSWLRLSWGAVEGALVVAGVLPVLLGNGVFAVWARARGLPGRHHLRALLGALAGAAAATTIAGLLLLLALH